MSDKKYHRNLSPGERMWLALDQQGSPMAYILVIEGIGDIPDGAMKEALYKISLLYPICRSKITGFLKNHRWEESDNFPRFKRLGTTVSPFGAWPLEIEKKMFWKKINLKKESPVMVYSLSDGNKQRLYIKIHHTAMDGMALNLFTNDLFKILRGEEPLGPTEGPETRRDLYAATLPDDFFEKRRQEFLKNKAAKPDDQQKEGRSLIFNGVYVGKHFISPPSKDNQMEWYTLFIPKEKMNTSSITGKGISAVMEALFKLNPETKDKKFQAGVAADLRYLMPGLRNAANLTGMIAVQLDKYSDVPFKERVALINNDIKDQIKKGWALTKHPPIIDWLPIRLMSTFIYIYRKIVFHKKETPYYFFFSNSGRYKLANLSTKGFKAQRVFAIPIWQICVPLFILMITHDNGIEFLCATDTDKAGLTRFVDLFRKEINSAEDKLA
ncbi:MAG: hypothetical protein J7L53_09375 [Deltaproteobacteria bacterium]|nr:hypothetical protein [Deltaproteobacteria bacterium]